MNRSGYKSTLLWLWHLGISDYTIVDYIGMSLLEFFCPQQFHSLGIGSLLVDISPVCIRQEFHLHFCINLPLGVSGVVSGSSTMDVHM